MSNFIHNQNKKTSKEQTEEAYYCITGKEDYLDKDNYPRCKSEDNKNVCAKKLLRADGSTKYTIKTGDDRKLFNPESIFDSTNSNRKFLETIARNQNSFKEVNHAAFIMYIRFLKTKNTAYLHNAEREI